MAKLTELEKSLETISADLLRSQASRDQDALNAADKLLNSRDASPIEIADQYGISPLNLAVLNPRTMYMLPGGGAHPHMLDYARIGLERAAASGSKSVLLVLAGHGTAVPQPYDQYRRVRGEVTGMIPSLKAYGFWGENDSRVDSHSHVEAELAHQHGETSCGGGDGRTDLVIRNLENNRALIADDLLDQVDEESFRLKGAPDTEVKMLSVMAITGRRTGSQRLAWNAYERNFKRSGIEFLTAKGLNALPNPETATNYVTRAKLESDMRQAQLIAAIVGAACLDVRQEFVGTSASFFDTGKINQLLAPNWFENHVLMRPATYANDSFETWMHSEAPLNGVNITSADGEDDPRILQQLIALSKIPQMLLNHTLGSEMRRSRRGMGRRTMSPATSTMVNIPDTILTDPRYSEQAAFLAAQTTQLVESLDSGGYRYESDFDDSLGSLKSEYVVEIDGEMKRVTYPQGMQFDVPAGDLGAQLLDAIKPSKADQVVNPNGDIYNPNPRHTVHADTQRKLGLQLA